MTGCNRFKSNSQDQWHERHSYGRVAIEGAAEEDGDPAAVAGLGVFDQLLEVVSGPLVNLHPAQSLRLKEIPEKFFSYYYSFKDYLNIKLPPTIIFPN